MMPTKSSAGRGAKPASDVRTASHTADVAAAGTPQGPVRDAAGALALDRRLAALGTLSERLVEIRRSVAGRVTFSTSLGIEDQAVLDGIADSGADIDVFTLDTGRHFPE